MALTNDIQLNGVSYNVVPGSYKKGLRKALSVSKPPTRKTGKAVFGPFQRGVLQAADDDEERGWSSLSVGPAFDGMGVEPFPNSTNFTDATIANPTLATRAYGLVAGDRAYVGIGTNLYRSAQLTNGTWAAFTLEANIGATIRGLSYYLDDILVFCGQAQDIRKYNTTSTGVSVWRAGQKAKFGVAYAGQKQ